MSYEVYRYIFLGALIACGVFFAIAVTLFFTLKIPKVISDLSGRTARKAIENIRQQNEQSGEKTYQSSQVNLERGKLTDKISKSGRLVPRNETPFGTGVITEKISTQKLDTAGETDVLAEPAGETTLLTEPAGETSLLAEPAGETTVLGAPVGETAVLGAPEQMQTPQNQGAFTIEYEITYIHTGEVIA